MEKYKGNLPQQKVGLEESQGGEVVGRHPDDLTIDELNSLGYFKSPILKVIRAKCLDCAHSQSEVRKCTAVVTCDLWPYRMGSNPFSERTGNPAAIEALKAWRNR